MHYQGGVLCLQWRNDGVTQCLCPKPQTLSQTLAGEQYSVHLIQLAGHPQPVHFQKLTTGTDKLHVVSQLQKPVISSSAFGRQPPSGGRYVLMFISNITETPWTILAQILFICSGQFIPRGIWTFLILLTSTVPIYLKILHNTDTLLCVCSSCQNY